LVYTTSTKTQFAGPGAHIAVIKLLRWLKEKYFSAFELSAEGMYWETMDEKILLSQFAKYEFLLTTVADAPSEMKAVPGETSLSLADRIEKMLKDNQPTYAIPPAILNAAAGFSKCSPPKNVSGAYKNGCDRNNCTMNNENHAGSWRGAKWLFVSA
jgi:hypothetical protein